MLKSSSLLAVAAGLFAFPAMVTAQDDEFFPGLIARYSADGKSIERIDPDVAFVWGSDSPDARLLQGPFQAKWNGQLLIRRPGRYRLHAFVQGDVEAVLNGTRFLSGSQSNPGWISGDEFPVPFGELPLEVTFRKTDMSAQLQLFWSSDAFPLEPLPEHLLFYDGPNPHLDSVRQGHAQFEAHRCNRCHRRENDTTSEAAPALTHFAAGLNHHWLVDKIHSSERTSPHARMPSFGFTRDESTAIAAFLLANAKMPELDSPGITRDPKNTSPVGAKKERRRGEIWFRSFGCLACHTVGKRGNAGPTSGGDLSTIGQKRSREWLFTWLGEPARLNPEHRMPTFRLKLHEQQELAAYLSSLGAREGHEESRDSFLNSDDSLLTTGRKLVESARCAACHRVAGIAFKESHLPDLSKSISDLAKTCLGREPDRKRFRPVYKAEDIDRPAIQAYVNSRVGSLSPEGEFATGRRLLERRGCVSCHERGTSRGITELAGKMSRIDTSLAGQSEALIPPSLTAIGDKLLDSALNRAIAGEQQSIRLDWLRVRMPRFHHSKAERQALLHYLVGHDRIPDGAPQAESVENMKLPSKEQMLVAGRTLAGPKGFSCIACHELAGYKPKNVALGTRGSDLHMLGKRMRASYYRRWTRSPLRIVPGMEMPSYERPIAGVFDGNLDAQLTATWTALNDPRMTAPTDPASVEQLLSVSPGAAARIVRDVFTLPDENGAVVPRSMAVGFHNGHNLLFDLKSPALRQWTFGDFARQRTIGKSWYWDMAGVTVISGIGTDCDFVLAERGEQNGPLILPKSAARLHDYESLDDGVTFRYALDFSTDAQPHTLEFAETVKPLPSEENGETSGWERSIDVGGIPNGYDLFIRRPKPTATLGGPRVDRFGNSQQAWIRLPADGDAETSSEFAPFQQQSESRTARIHLQYRSSLKRPNLTRKTKAATPVVTETVTTVPGYEGVRLPVDRSIMPTALTWTSSGVLAFTSLKGHVYLAHDTDGDGVEDKLTLFEEGLAAPYGILDDGDDLLVSHKPEILRLRDTDGDGRADAREVVASGWGYTDNYHDWTCGIVRDSKNRLYVGLGSDYTQKNRPRDEARWRGKVLRINPNGTIEPVGHSFRYPTGLAINGNDQIFITDNQGVQNCFNEINFLAAGNHYGVPSQYEPNTNASPTAAAIQVPHPWTRSVNGIFFIPNGRGPSAFAGHGIGCELNGRFLVRFTFEEVNGTMQGAVYPFSRPNTDVDTENLLGPLCGAANANGDLYIGSIRDSGWLGGRNTGAIVRLRPNGRMPNGIREVRAMPNSFQIEFLASVDATAAVSPDSYSVSGYQRVWQGGYATPDSGRHQASIQSASLSDDGKTVRLHVEPMRSGFVYEIHCDDIGTGADGKLWPTTAHYTLHSISTATTGK